MSNLTWWHLTYIVVTSGLLVALLVAWNWTTEDVKLRHLLLTWALALFWPIVIPTLLLVVAWEEYDEAKHD